MFNKLQKAQKIQLADKLRRMELLLVTPNKKPAGIPTGFSYEVGSLSRISG